MVARYFEALNGHDPDAVAACVTDDFVNEHTSALGSSSAGRDVYHDRLPGFLAQFEQLHYEVVDSLTEADRCAIRYRLTAVYDGHPIDISGVMLFTVRDGLVAHRTDFWDSLTFMRQTGVQ